MKVIRRQGFMSNSVLGLKAENKDCNSVSVGGREHVKRNWKTNPALPLKDTI